MISQTFHTHITHTHTTNLHDEPSYLKTTASLRYSTQNSRPSCPTDPTTHDVGGSESDDAWCGTDYDSTDDSVYIIKSLDVGIKVW